jgi:HD-GYP domain-containing protein (c-di-GMP phosphodiesterase class II)
MGVFQCNELDLAVMHELVDDINDNYKISEHALLELDRQPDDVELKISLFRAVHTIKGDLAIVGFAPALPLINGVEALLSLLREGKISYNPLLSDLVLLVLDRVRSFVDGFKARGFIEYDKHHVVDLSRRITDITTSIENSGYNVEHNSQIASIIRMLDPSVIVDAGQGADDSRVQVDSYLQGLGLTPDNDLAFFRDMMEPVERRSEYWHGRSDRILKMALILNQLGGSPVDELQLAAAVYVHDFGMAFIPLEHTVLSDSEIALLRSHVQSSAHLLQNMEQWSEAKEIVLQHHEAANGLGYPYGLRDREICDGAKILAIADTFDALTHQRAYATHQKRPIIRAVKEINDCAGRQLSAEWIDVFNQAVQPVLSAHLALKL